MNWKKRHAREAAWQYLAGNCCLRVRGTCPMVAVCCCLRVRGTCPMVAVC